MVQPDLSLTRWEPCTSTAIDHAIKRIVNSHNAEEGKEKGNR